MAKSAETLRDEALDQLARFERLTSRAIPEQDIVSARLRVTREEAQKLVAVSSAAAADRTLHLEKGQLLGN